MGDHRAPLGASSLVQWAGDAESSGLLSAVPATPNPDLGSALAGGTRRGLRATIPVDHHTGAAAGAQPLPTVTPQPVLLTYPKAEQHEEPEPQPRPQRQRR